jgi:hypothetical protein
LFFVSDTGATRVIYSKFLGGVEHESAQRSLFSGMKTGEASLVTKLCSLIKVLINVVVHSEYGVLSYATLIGIGRVIYISIAVDYINMNNILLSINDKALQSNKKFHQV